MRANRVFQVPEGVGGEIPAKYTRGTAIGPFRESPQILTPPFPQRNNPVGRAMCCNASRLQTAAAAETVPVAPLTDPYWDGANAT